MELTRRKELCQSAQAGFFDGKLKTIQTESRRRYRMQVKDSKDRTDRGLSAIPSTKSTSAVDRFVERLAIEMFQDPDSISFTNNSALDPAQDFASLILTQDFIYRSSGQNGMFPFFTWHQASSLTGAVDGLEAALVWWRHEAYTEPETTYSTLDGKPVTAEEYKLYSRLMPDSFVKTKGTKKTVITDTWWVDSLEVGKDVIWDPTPGLLDVELGQFVRVLLNKSIDQIKAMGESGVLDKSKLTDEILKKYQKTAATNTLILSRSGNKTVDNGQDVDLKDHNTVELEVFFYKEGCRWYVAFSLGDFAEELSVGKPVNEVFFGGRAVNILPVSVGYNKPKLLEQVGWAIPELIAPLEDEHTNHRNNVNDAAKIAIQGRWWMEEGGDTNIDNLLNARVVYGKMGQDFGPLETNMDVITSMRADDTLNMEINELIPAGLQSSARGIVPKGTNKTLGATQLGKMESDEKLGVQIVTRNQTFFYKVMYLIAQLTIAFETSETVLKIAGNKAGVQLPMVTKADGTQVIDIAVLDFDVSVKINAGLGSSPRYQKAQSTMQLVDWGKGHGENVATTKAFRQLSVLAGYGPDDLLNTDPPPPPPPPQVDYKLNLAMTLSELLAISPQAGTLIEQKMMLGQVSVDTKVKENPALNEARQNGGGMMTPDRTGQIVDGTSEAAMGMSEGGMQ